MARPVIHGRDHAAGGADPIPGFGAIFTLPFIIDGGGAAITTGDKGDVPLDFAATILSWELLADASGSIVVDIKKSTYSGFPPTSSIVASAAPTLSSAAKNTSSTLTGWTTAIAAGDILRFHVNSATTVQRVTVALKLRRS